MTDMHYLNYEEQHIDPVFDFTACRKVLDKNGRDESKIIAVLQGIQQHYRYLPREVFPYISNEMEISEAKIYGIATFYENFSLEPKGKYVIKVCDGTACHVRKSIPILNRLRAELGLTGEDITTGDMLFTVETVSCLGACSLSPVVMVGDEVYAAMTPDKAAELIQTLRQNELRATIRE
ncbi:MAG: NAD(P)H-dependent oxidoreductase subunit E [Clostridiales Family XIII bacterium]|jgi:NADH-quinone oxidoreductase subunit E|nr:NAD(P)H-dependent oxidoreductase subunit E [Clostridiales Family XIII bacterium]